jgi:hypothetical protein
MSISRGLVHPVLKLLGWDTTQSRIPDYSGLVRSYLGKGVRLFNILFIVNALGFSGEPLIIIVLPTPVSYIIIQEIKF